MIISEKFSGRSSAVLAAMIAFVLTIVIVVLAVVFTYRFLYASRIILYALVAAGLVINFGVKKILSAVPWIISAVLAVTVAMYALGGQFFFNEDAKIFIAQKLSPQNLSPKKTFSLLTIGLMLEFREKIF